MIFDFKVEVFGSPKNTDLGEEIRGALSEVFGIEKRKIYIHEHYGRGNNDANADAILVTIEKLMYYPLTATNRKYALERVGDIMRLFVQKQPHLLAFDVVFMPPIQY